MIKKTVCWFAIAALTMSSVGCYSSRMVSVQETEAIKNADVIKITAKDGRIFELTDVKIEYPNIEGYDRTPNSQRNWTWIVLNVDDIRSVESKKINYYKTAIFAGAVGGVIWLFVESVKGVNIMNNSWGGLNP
jgi:hypothetical protein